MNEDESRALFDGVLATFGERPRLTPREREVLYHRVVVGLSSRDIAGVLTISPKTVETHLATATAKLQHTGRSRDLWRALFRAYVWMAVTA